MISIEQTKQEVEEIKEQAQSLSNTFFYTEKMSTETFDKLADILGGIADSFNEILNVLDQADTEANGIDLKADHEYQEREYRRVN